MRNTYNNFHEDICKELGRIKNPPSNLVEICTKFIFMISNQSINWQEFKVNLYYFKLLVLFTKFSKHQTEYVQL